MAEFRIVVVVDATRAQRGSRQVEGQLERINRAAERTRRIIANAFAFAGFSGGIAGTIALADAFTVLQNRLRVVTDGTLQLTEVTDALFDVSRRTRSSFELTSRLYGRVALASRELGRSQAELLQFTEDLNLAVILSGSTTQEAAAGLIQFSQGLASGALRGDELRSVLEQLPVVADVIAAELGVTRGALRDLGAEGAITARVVLDAFEEASESLQERFAESVRTVSQSFTILRSSVVLTLGELNEATGAMTTLSNAIIFLADNMDTLVNLALQLTFVLGTVLVARTGSSIIRTLIRITTSTAGATAAFRGLIALFGGPFGVAIAGITTALFFYETGQARAAAEAERLTRLQTPLRDALGLTQDAAEDLAQAFSELGDSEQVLFRDRLEIRVADLETALADARARLTRPFERLIGPSANTEIAPFIDDIQGALARFNESNDVAGFVAFLDIIAEKAEGIRDRLGEVIRDQINNFIVALDEDDFDFLDAAEQLEEALAAVQDIAEDLTAEDTIAQFFRVLGEEAEDALSQLEVALISAEEARDTVTNILRSNERGRLISEGDLQALTEYDQSLRVLTEGTQAFDDALEDTDNLVLAITAGLAAAGEASAELALQRERETAAVDDLLIRINRELDVRRAVAEGNEREVETLEALQELEAFRASLLQQIEQRLGFVSDELAAYVERLVDELRVVQLLEDAQKDLNDARNAANFGTFTKGLEFEIAELEREQVALLAGAEAHAEYTRQRAIRAALEESLQGRSGLTREDIEEVEELAERLVDLQISNAELRAEFRTSGRDRDDTTFDDIIEDLEREAELLRLSNDERLVRQAVLQAEDQLERSLLPTEQERLRLLVLSNEEQARLNRLFDGVVDPLRTYAEGLDELNRLLDANIIGTQEYEDALRGLQIRLLQSNRDLESGIALGLLQIEEEFGNVAAVAEDLLVNAFQGAEDALVDLVTTGKLEFSDLVDSILADLARLAIRQSITAPLAGALGSLGSSLFGSIFGGGGGGIAPSDAIFSGLGFFANGAILSGPTLMASGRNAGVGGEAGPEGLLPLANVNGRLGVHSTGGGGDVEVNVYDQRTGGGEAVEVRERQLPGGRRQLGIFIRDGMKSSLQNGELDGPMERRYGVKPVTALR